jgi:HPt (histidine-containing phosphotransfer) domain-containing protein
LTAKEWPVDPAHSAALNREALVERLGGDLELFQEITGLFRKDCPRLLSEIRSAVSEDNAPALERAAHTLKGSVANFGAEAAYAAAFRLEQMGRARQMEGAAGACQTLEAEIARFEHALEALARELARS